MKYTPTKNMFQIWDNPSERKDFMDAAMEEAKQAFMADLKEEGYKTLDEYKDYLRTFSDADLLWDIIGYREDRDQEDEWANHSNITPDKSFHHMIAYCKHIINIDVHKEVIREMMEPEE